MTEKKSMYHLIFEIKQKMKKQSNAFSLSIIHKTKMEKWIQTTFVYRIRI